MKNSLFQTILNVVLVAAVVALFVMNYGKDTKKASVAEGEVAAVSDKLPVAYLNIDSLLLNYQFAQEANEKLMSKQEDARLKLNTKLRTLQNEMADFQRKLDNGAFLSQERAQKEYQRLQKKQQDLEQLEAKLTQDILEENQALNLQLSDSLMNYLKTYNADGRFEIILNNNAKDNILMAADGYDITNDVVNGLNARYAK
ncbi:MAG: OmpH family outer membrane protein [Paludibacteraceae bacterium]|nr:OmpH family outer membrane protein [Paludibacteraceae bacterium]